MNQSIQDLPLDVSKARKKLLKKVKSFKNPENLVSLVEQYFKITNKWTAKQEKIVKLNEVKLQQLENALPAFEGESLKEKQLEIRHARAQLDAQINKIQSQRLQHSLEKSFC